MAKEPKGITPIDIFTKTLFQIFLVVLEVGGVGFLIASQCDKYLDAQNLTDWLSYFLMGSSVYEIMIMCIFAQISDARKDALLSVKTACKYAELYCESNSADLKKSILTIIEHQLKPEVFNHTDVRKVYCKLRDFIEEKDIYNIKRLLIETEHAYEAEDLKWKHSIVLRLFK